MGLNHAFGPKIAFFRKLFFLPIQARKMSFTIFYNEKTFFQAIKCLLRYSTAKNRLSFLRLFQAIQARKMSFTVFQNKKKPLQAIKTRSSKSLSRLLKTRSSKSRKIDNFPKGVKPWFSSKNGHFSKLFFLGNIGNGKCLLQYPRTKKSLSRLQKQEVQIFEKLTVFQSGQTMVLVQKQAFFQSCFFQAIKARKMSFTIFYNEKTPFQAIKTRS